MRLRSMLQRDVARQISACASRSFCANESPRCRRPTLSITERVASAPVAVAEQVSNPTAVGAV